MPITPRAQLGNSLGGGLWKKTALEQESAAPTEIVIVDELPADRFKSAMYAIAIWDDTGDKVKTMFMNLGRRGGQLVESIYGKTGDPISVAIDTADIGDKVVVTLTNNDSFNINFDITRLALGRP